MNLKVSETTISFPILKLTVTSIAFKIFVAQRDTVTSPSLEIAYFSPTESTLVPPTDIEVPTISRPASRLKDKLYSVSSKALVTENEISKAAPTSFSKSEISEIVGRSRRDTVLENV